MGKSLKSQLCSGCAGGILFERQGEREESYPIYDVLVTADVVRVACHRGNVVARSAH